MIQWLLRLDISSNFCCTVCSSVSIVMCTKSTFNRPMPGQMQVFIYLQGCFQESITVSPSITKLLQYFKYFICKSRVYPIANAGNDKPPLVGNIILPFLHWENITDESLWKMLSKPGTTPYVIWELVFPSEDNKLVTICLIWKTEFLLEEMPISLYLASYPLLELGWSS